MKALSLVACGVVLAAMWGCGSGGGFSERERSAQKSSNVFTYPIVTNPTTLDPAVVQDGDTIDLLQQVYEGLVGWNEKNEVVPLLAETITLKDGGKSYEFKLRKDVKFHNGKALTSEDVKWSLERLCRSGVQSPNPVPYFGDIVGVKDMVEGKAKSISGIVTPDPMTVIITIDKPRPYFLGKFSYLASAILPKGSVPENAKITDIKQAIGTGPFKFAKYEPEQLIRLEANKDYYLGAPKIDAIERPVVKDAVTRLSMYRQGKLDLVMLERQDVAGLQKDEKFKDDLKFFPRPAIWYIGLNQAKQKEFKDLRVRQAIAMSIDREKIVNELLGGVNQIANGVLPPGVKGHRETTPKIYKYDPVAAKKLLAEAGFPDGKGLPTLELWFRENRPDIKIAAEAVASQLQKNLGVNVKLTVKEWTAYLAARDRREVPFFHMRWAADYLDPENFISFFFNTQGGENRIGYVNPKVDALTNEADAMPDGPERLAKYAEAEDIAIADVAMIPLYFQRDAELINKRVKGLRESAFGHLPHTTVSLD